MMVILFTIISVLAIFLISAIVYIIKIQKELIEIDREQHTQNKEIIELMRRHTTHQEMLLQHIEILKYLIEQDEFLGKKHRWPISVGEA